MLRRPPTIPYHPELTFFIKSLQVTFIASLTSQIWFQISHHVLISSSATVDFPQNLRENWIGFPILVWQTSGGWASGYSIWRIGLEPLMDSEFPFQGSQKLLFASAVVGALNIDF